MSTTPPRHDTPRPTRRRSARPPGRSPLLGANVVVSVIGATLIALAIVLAAGRASATRASAERRAEARAEPPRFADAHLATGVRVRYAAAGDPAGHPVILLHGYSDSWFSFSRVLPLLPGTLRVYALDQRGHGDSDRPADGYEMRDLAADVVAFMDAHGITQATVVGHSMGSFVAQQVALAAPARVAGLVLIGSATTPRAVVGMSELAAAVAALEDPVPEPFAREFQESTVHHPVPAEFMDRAVGESLRLPARVWQALMDGMLATDAPARLGDHGIPTLLVRGDRDALMTAAEQDSLLRLIGTASLRTYEETGHAPHWERPERFVADLVAFIGPR